MDNNNIIFIIVIFIIIIIYNNIYNNNNNNNNSNNSNRNEILGKVDINFSNFITVDKIKNKIGGLPSNKACGLDEIHTIILQSINNSKFPIILFHLFKCVLN